MNLSILDLVKSLVKGLSFLVWIWKSKNVKFGKWSAISVIRLPEEHLFWINFLGHLMKIWSISVAEWSVILVGSVIQGIKLYSKKLFRYAFTLVSFSCNRSMLTSPSTMARVFLLILLIVFLLHY